MAFGANPLALADHVHDLDARDDWRQQSDRANGTIFVSPEDETGVVRVTCWKRVREEQRAPLLQARLMGVHGVWRREEDVMNLIAGRIGISHRSSAGWRARQRAAIFLDDPLVALALQMIGKPL